MNSSRPALSATSRLLAVSAAVLLLAGISRADLSANREFQASLAAMADSLPAVAARKLEALLTSPDALANAGERKEVQRRLAEALVRSGQFTEAAGVASRTLIEDDPKAQFWKAMAYASLERTAEAEALLAPLSADPEFEFRKEAALTRAELLETLGDPDAALAVLEPLTGDPKVALQARLRAAGIELAREDFEAAGKWIASNPVGSVSEQGQAEIDFLRARIAAKAGRFEEAVTLFHDLAVSESKQIPVAIRHGAFLGEADAHTGAIRLDLTVKSLLALIATHPNSPLLESAFQRLEDYELLELASTEPRLQSWSRDQSNPARKAMAAFYLGVSLRQTGQSDEAIAYFTDFREKFPGHPLATAAALETVELLVQSQRKDEAAALITQLRANSPIPEVIAYLDSLEARVGFSEGDYALAAAKFVESAENPGGEGPSADFNAAVSALYADDPVAFEKFATRLQKAPEKENLNAELILEQGLYHAANANSEAFETLEEFLRQHGTHPRSADARLALAELYLNQVPAQAEPAREQLEAARSGKLTPEQREWLDYVALWVEVSAGDDQAIAEVARKFIDTWENSKRRPSVHMILGEAFYRLQDYANAITFFERLAEESPDSAFALPALFFAAKAASLTLVEDNQQFAIETWARVAEAGGALAAPARHEQGLLKLRLDQVDDAISAFDSILSMEEVDPELRIATLCDKGQALFTKGTAAENNPSDLEAAIAAFESVENDPAASRGWKYQAAVRRGNCLEALGRLEEALEVYYDIVRSGGPLGPVASVPVEEFDWFFRAGIAAVQLLQKQKNWEAAIKIADRLAQAGGPRATEAANLADRLRLRHFIWDEPEE